MYIRESYDYIVFHSTLDSDVIHSIVEHVLSGLSAIIVIGNVQAEVVPPEIESDINYIV